LQQPTARKYNSFYNPGVFNKQTMQSHCLSNANACEQEKFFVSPIKIVVEKSADFCSHRLVLGNASG